MAHILDAGITPTQQTYFQLEHELKRLYDQGLLKPEIYPQLQEAMHPKTATIGLLKLQQIQLPTVPQAQLRQPTATPVPYRTILKKRGIIVQRANTEILVSYQGAKICTGRFTQTGIQFNQQEGPVFINTKILAKEIHDALKS